MTDALRRLPTFAVHAGEALAIAILGISALAIGGWLLARVARRWGTDETPVGTFHYLAGGERADEDLRKHTEQRREAAARMRKRAQKVESGAPVSDVLRAVK